MERGEIDAAIGRAAHVNARRRPSTTSAGSHSSARLATRRTRSPTASAAAATALPTTTVTRLAYVPLLAGKRAVSPRRHGDRGERHVEALGADLGEGRLVALALRRRADRDPDGSGGVDGDVRALVRADPRRLVVGGDADPEPPALARAPPAGARESRRSRLASARSRAARDSRPSRGRSACRRGRTGPAGSGISSARIRLRRRSSTGSTPSSRAAMSIRRSRTNTACVRPAPRYGTARHLVRGHDAPPTAEHGKAIEPDQVRGRHVGHDCASGQVGSGIDQEVVGQRQDAPLAVVHQFEPGGPARPLTAQSRPWDTPGMAKRPYRPRDAAQRARFIIEIATGERPNDSPSRADARAIASRRKGGLRGGPARASSLSAASRKKIARKAAAARWSKAQAPDSP